MKVALVHYHLRRGGVTRVIENALTALSLTDIKAVVLSGEAYSAPTIAGVPVKLVSGLGYQDNFGDGEELAQRLQLAAREYFGTKPDLWHFHNHNLGKNIALTAAVTSLAKNGAKMLLQIHDFAEDGRPTLYQKLQHYFADSGGMAGTYPRAKSVHYAVINERDYDALREVGIPDVHLLANPVSLNAQASPALAQGHRNTRLFLYPSRAIRRKNIGEFLLWSALAQDGERYAITLEPENPAEMPGYREWVAFAQSRQLPVDFAVGLEPSNSLPRLMAAATAVVTTSIAEGFGLAFLEPYLSGRPVLGRDLPPITKSFKAAGIELPDLYSRLMIPQSYLGDETELLARFCRGYETLLGLYGQKLDRERLAELKFAFLQDGQVDFAKLDEELQRKVIVLIQKGRLSRDACLPAPPLAPSQAGMMVIGKNTQVLKEKFGLTNYGEQLLAIYAKILASTAGENPPFQANRLVQRFLAPENFSQLKVPTNSRQEVAR